MTAASHPGFHGPKAWLVSIIAGALLGALLTRLLPAAYHGGQPVIPLWLVVPFALLLASIALMPFVSPRAWHDHFPDFAFFLGSVVTAYYLVGFSAPDPGHLPYGPHHMLHAGIEYYSFIALVGGLYIVSGSILVDIRGRGHPVANTLILAVGAVLANLVGTTGASMLLIRPFMRINKGRLRPIHVVLFIFIVSNCGGSLTPIGDPPLYLGYLKGVPFRWVAEHMWADWIFVVGSLLIVFYIIDRRIGPATSRAGPPIAHEPEAEALAASEISARPGIRLRGGTGMVCLVLMIAGVFIDPMLRAAIGLEGVPVGATFQVLVAYSAWRLVPDWLHDANDFTFFPVKEVGLLFLGIFATMVPALGYLSVNGPGLGLTTPTAFYFSTGALSAVLDNAPTYLNFLQIAFGETGIDHGTMAAFLAEPRNVRLLSAISTSAVYFGAMTYIGNGPNFMVKAIAEAAGVKMPSFFGYLTWAVVILLPILILHWLLFIR